MESLTQKYKTSSMRTLIMRTLQGLPINARTQQVFDLDDADIETEGRIIDEYADPLEVSDIKICLEDELAREHAKKVEESKQQHKNMLAELDELRKFKETIEKGGNSDETTPSQNSQKV